MPGIHGLDRPDDKPPQAAAEGENKEQHENHTPRESEASHDGGRFDIAPRITTASTGP